MSIFEPQSDANIEDVLSSYDSFSKAGASLGLELSKLSYSLDFDKWIEAGWFDISIKIREKIYSAKIALEENDKNKSRFYRILMPKFSKFVPAYATISAGMQLSSTSDLYGGERGRAVTLAKKTADQKYLIAIGLAGTGKNFISWFLNFDFDHEDGLHAGFKQVGDSFFSFADSIEFPALARELNLNRLSLKDIFISAKDFDSPFKLFLSGHSQGAAAAQIVMLRLRQMGVFSKNIVSYGFAPPTTACMSFISPSMPLFLIGNKDDVFSKVGLEKHLGNYYLYESSDNMRKRCYGDNLQCPLFMQALKRFNAISDTKDSVFLSLAFMYAASYLPKKEADKIGEIWGMHFLPQKMQVNTVPVLRAYLREKYEILTGMEPDEKKLLDSAREIYNTLKHEDIRNIINASMNALRAAHSLNVKDEGMLSSYAYIVQQDFNKLEKIS